ncbi:hypothetical protein OUZ56_003653 [Daphnia magna]|uniref:Uncharacterized protein n=1 Tax=Daphnia magna TaxID=35525 RepID=A0ABR0A9Q7_9CRUS|nr:hypothetical protein OUZ56_003653 [Daphnia magna]
MVRTNVIMAKATSVQNVYFLMVLFDFTKQPPGIASVSAIFKPTLCKDKKDVLALLSLRIESKRQVVVRRVAYLVFTDRRPKGDSSHWNLKPYINNIEDCYHRVGVPICFSEETGLGGKLAMDHVQPKKKVVSRSHRQLSYSSQQDQSFRRSHFEKENEELKAKIRELEEQLTENGNSTMEAYKSKISALEKELDQMRSN